MEKDQTTTIRKALEINLDPMPYGSFAEIGAGQEVARYFFLAGKASQTVAKTMSAYDMVVSDAIYGRETNGRYVCQTRLMKMLDHEYDLMQERLQGSRGEQSRFFSFANTVATGKQHHGWIGIKFQTRPNGPANWIVLHVQLLNRSRLLQQEALGVLGVNLIYSALYDFKTPEKVVESLIDNIGPDRIEVDMLSFHGEDLKHVDNRLISLKLIQEGLTGAVLFSPKGEVLQPSDALYKKSVFVHRGTFRPITEANLVIHETGLKTFIKDYQLKKDNVQVVFEITMHNLQGTAGLDARDFLDRVDTLSSLGYGVLISNFLLYYQIKSFLRRHTSEPIGMVIGGRHLEKLMDEKYYLDLPGGILESFGRLGGEKTCLYVYPFKTSEKIWTAHTYQPQGNLAQLYQYLLSKRCFVDIEAPAHESDSLHSEKVRQLLLAGDSDWEKLVPDKVVACIKERKIFGYSSKKK